MGVWMVNYQKCCQQNVDTRESKWWSKFENGRPTVDRYRLGVGISVLTFWQNFFESVNKKKVYQFFWNMTKGGKLGLSPCCFLIHHNNDPLVWQPPTWSFHVPTMRNVLFQQQEWLDFLQMAFVTDSRIYMVMAFSQRACWMKTSFNPARCTSGVAQSTEQNFF